MATTSSSPTKDRFPNGNESEALNSPEDGAMDNVEVGEMDGEEDIATIKPRLSLPLGRIAKYLTLAVGANTLLWAGTLSYLKHTAPTYTSELVVHVAGNALGVNLNLPDVGQAATSTTSAFGSSSDPRENYKLLALGDTVIQEAAASVSIEVEEFGEPKIILIPNTTTIRISQSGPSPKIAQRKALSLYQTLERRLNTLRQIEQEKRDGAITSALEDSQNKLTQAQAQLSNYKAQSGLSSSQQVTNLISTIETLRKQRAEKVAQSQQIGDRLQSLTLAVQLAPEQAPTVLALQTDQYFQKSLQEYTTTSTELNALLEERGPNYPDVVQLKQKQGAALATVLERGKALLGKAITLEEIERLNLDNSNESGVKRGELFQQLITLQAEYEGIRAEVDALTQQVSELEARLKIMVQKESVLENYLRKVQIAEAIFTSTLAKADLGKSDPFGSFPLMQLVEPPTLPDAPSAPKTKLVLAGAAIGSVLVTFGLTLLWWRNTILVVLTKISRQILA
ncbi:hypothetical protein [Synechocystis sp. LEGE 06083]|uniref:GumC family protein n=1 Tax=Synechocystis sp. LEGE 06083 TaxID=915336 RepID=UPI001D13E732|nr:hypothetical protein [Synechocystis sp. LEGE 06083]